MFCSAPPAQQPEPAGTGGAAALDGARATVEEEQRRLAGMSDFEKLARIEALTGGGNGATPATATKAMRGAGAGHGKAAASPMGDHHPYLASETSHQLLKTEPLLDQKQPLTRGGLREQVPYVARPSPGGQRAEAMGAPSPGAAAGGSAWMSRIASFMDMPPADDAKNQAQKKGSQDKRGGRR